MASVSTYCSSGDDPYAIRILCKVCDLELDPISARQHLLGSRHINACLDQDKGSCFVCFHCGVWCNSERNLQDHFDGWTHSMRLNWLGEDQYQLSQYGNNCLAASSGQSQRWHEASEASHSSRYPDSGTDQAAPQVAADPPPPSSMHCRLCNFTGAGQAAFRHFTGNAHQMRAARLIQEGHSICAKCGCFCPDHGNLVNLHQPGARHQSQLRWFAGSQPQAAGQGVSAAGSSSVAQQMERLSLTAADRHGPQNVPAPSVPAVSRGPGSTQQVACREAAADAGLLAPGLLKDLEDLLTCPITHEVMSDPVQISDGTTYERTAIASWLQQHHTSPLTGLRLEDTRTQVPNRALSSVAALFNRFKAITLENG